MLPLAVLGGAAAAEVWPTQRQVTGPSAVGVSDIPASHAGARSDMSADGEYRDTSRKGSVEQVAFAVKAVSSKHKLTFVTEKVCGSPPFLKGLRKILILGPGRIAAARAFNMRRIRKLSKQLRAKSNRRISDCHPDVAAVLRASGKDGLHVCLFEFLLKEMGWVEPDLVAALLRGFPLIGDIPVVPTAKRSMCRTAIVNPSDIDACPARQRQRVSSMSAEDLEIASQILEEVQKGRLEPHRSHCPKGKRVMKIRAVTKRFAAKQVNSKGKAKIRAIDDFTGSQVNLTCSVRRKIRMGSVKQLQATMRLLRKRFPRARFKLLKSDVKSAYRVCPILPSHHKYACIEVAFPRGFRRFIQLAMPFGAVGAVYAWDRIGEALQAIICRYLLIALQRYVDDFFGVDFHSCARQARMFLLELFQLLGISLAVDKTPLPAFSMPVLGLELVSSCLGKLVCNFDPDKVAVWVRMLQSLVSGSIHERADASETAGKLAFACWSVGGPVYALQIESVVPACCR